MFFLFAVVFVFFGSHANAIDDDIRCDLSNSTCQVEFIKYYALLIGATGVQELGVGPVDPIDLQPASMPVMDIMELSLLGGKCYNIVKTCRITELKMDIENFRRIVKVNCGQLVIQGTYALETNPAFCQVLGDVSGCGNGTIVLDDWSFYFNNPFRFVERNGKIYLEVDHDSGVYESNVQTKATFYADNIRVDNRDITKKVLRFMNKNWREVVDVFGGYVFEKARQYYKFVYNKFFAFKPATEFYTNDLTQYLDCN